MKLITFLNLNRKSAPSSSYRRMVIAILLTVISGGNAVRAAITQYSDPSSFASANQAGSYLNDFTGAGSGTSLSFSGGTGPFAYTITASGSFGVTGVPMDGASGLGTSVSTFDPNATLIITFTGTNKPTAIGGNFFWSDLSSPSDVVSGTIHANFKIGGSSVHTIDIPSTGNTSIGFGGITTDGVAFDSLELTLLSYISGDFFSTVDNFRIGQVTYNVLPPSLTARVHGSDLVISWPQAAAAYALESSTNTASGTWEAVTNQPVIVNLENTVTNRISGGSRFYRLRK
jgi:hypothetical protein